MNSLKIAYNNLKKNKSRTILTMVAIALGISILIIMVATGGGLKKMVLSEVDGFGFDMISVETRIPGKKRDTSATDFSKGITITTFKNKDVSRLKKHENVESIYGFVTGQEVIRRGNEDRNILIFGYGAGAPDVQRMDIGEGRFYTEDEESSISSVIVLGSELKEILFGDDDPLLQTVYVRNLPFKVVGILKERTTSLSMDLNRIAFMPTLTMQKKLLGTDYVLGVAIKVKDVSRINETKEDLTYIMREQHNIENPDEDDFEVSTIAETIQMVNNIINGINAFLIALALVSLVVGGVGIMNIMYVSVSERVFEIGLRMALGARKKDILYQFLAEAVLLTIAGGVLGLVLGLFICLLFNNLSSALGIGIYAVISISSIVFAFIFAGALGLVSGIYPAIKASNLDPITALRK